jgi:hypothetical protein
MPPPLADFSGEPLISADIRDMRTPQIDSWWHAFDNNEYFEDIPAQVGQLFPRGLAWLYKQLGEQTFGAHWGSSFSAESPYVQEFSPGDGWLPSSPNGVRVHHILWNLSPPPPPSLSSLIVCRCRR